MLDIDEDPDAVADEALRLIHHDHVRPRLRGTPDGLMPVEIRRLS